MQRLGQITNVLHHTTLWLTEVRLLAEYGLLDNFALQTTVPVRIIGTKTVFTDLAGNPIQLDYENIHHRNEVLVGVGDVRLYAHLGGQFLGLKASVRFGLSLPTGKVHENPYVLGALGLPHSTSNLVPVPLIRCLDSTLRRTLVRGHSRALLKRKFHSMKARRVGVIAAQEWAERWNGRVPTEDGNQGRTDLFLGSGITIPFADDYSVSFDVRARVYGHTVNAELSLPILVEVSIGRLFHLESRRTELGV